MLQSELMHQEAELWDVVVEIWDYARAKNINQLTKFIHPDYSGWETGAPRPHDRASALNAIASDMMIVEYALSPMEVKVINDCVGVAHYTYQADVLQNTKKIKIQGRWTEVYLKDHGHWKMISVQGGPEQETEY